MKRFILGTIAAIVAVMGVAAQPVMAKVTCPSDTLNPGKDVNSLAECMLKPEDAPSEVAPVVKNIINVIIGVMGVVAVGVIILGGFYFLTSQGDASKVTKGKNTILYGVVGLVVAILAFAIVNFVMTGVFKTDSSTGGGTSQGTDN